MGRVLGDIVGTFVLLDVWGGQRSSRREAAVPWSNLRVYTALATIDFDAMLFVARVVKAKVFEGVPCVRLSVTKCFPIYSFRRIVGVPSSPAVPLAEQSLRE